MNKYAESLNYYRMLNKKAQRHGAVFFGADLLSKIPIAELARDGGIELAVYNRSLKGLIVDDTEQVLEDCIFALFPDKVFINIGENDIEKPNFENNEFREKYEWLLYTIHSRCCCKIYIISVINDKENNVNKILENVAEKYACEYIDAADYRTPDLKFFTKIKHHLRTYPIDFCEIFRL